MRILYVSGSFGLGHVTRDLAIARALRQLSPGVDLVWLAGEPARSVLAKSGETLHPRAGEYRSDSDPADRAASVGGLNVFRYLLAAQSHWSANARVVAEAARSSGVEAVVGDETYEVSVALIRRAVTLDVPYVILLDFLGLDPTSHNPLEHLGVALWNRMWARDRRLFEGGRNRALFIGEPEDIPDRPLGLGLPTRREYARRHYHFVGYVLPFELGEVADRAALRAELGWSEAPLVVASTGGTAVGRDLLESCAEACAGARERLPGLQSLLVCGPRIDPGLVKAPPGGRVEGFVPRLYRHLAACDIAVVQAGGTTTLELTALRRPFVYVPMEGQCEQEVAVSGRLARHGAGIRLTRRELSVRRLTELLVANVGREVTWQPIPVDGARTAAANILEAVAAAPRRAA